MVVNIIDISVFVGKVFTDVHVQEDDKDEIVFTCEDGTKYIMVHEQDCCESVKIEDITGDLSDLIGSPILKATEDTNRDCLKEEDSRCLWTFYNFSTIKGSVTIRWYGGSNGYYSESVSLFEVR